MQEVVDHLVESHGPAVGHLREMLQGRRPEGGAIPASLPSAEPLARDQLGALLTGHRRSL